MPKCNTYVVKLGGSLIGSGELEHWLGTLATISQRHTIVIVPGGGLFADAVREAQTRMPFTDELGHRLALQAMRQFGMLLMSDLVAAQPCWATVDDFKNGTRHPGLYIWDPIDPALTSAGLPQNWSTTSDSLSLWVTARTAGAAVALVKSRRPHSNSGDVESLSGEAFVDESFPTLLNTLAVAVYWFEKSEHQQWKRLVEGESAAELQAHRITGGSQGR